MVLLDTDTWCVFLMLRLSWCLPYSIMVYPSSSSR